MANRRDRNQTHDTKGEAQNVNIDPERSGKLASNDKDMEHAKSKAKEGMKQRRDSDNRNSNRDSGRLNDTTGVE